MSRVPVADRGPQGRAAHLLARTNAGSPLSYIPAERDGPAGLVVAGMHGDEPECVVALSAGLRSLPPGALAVPVLLAANPDGLLAGTRANGAGVDLNRNFPTSNWSPEPTFFSWSSAHSRETRLSPGSAPASEAETKQLIGLVEALSPEWVVSVHAPLGLVEDPTEHPVGVNLAERMQLPFEHSVGYETPGSFGTWLAARGVSPITVEFPHVTADTAILTFADVLADLLSGRVGSADLQVANP